MNSWRRVGHPGAAAAIAVALAACGGGSGPDDAHDHAHVDTAGRLALLEAGTPAIRIHDLDSKSVVATFPLANPPSTVLASPGGRYALAVQREQDLVQVVDGGIWQEDHVDHLHDYKEAPKLLDFSIAGVRPTHYEVHDDLAALFLDGLADTGQVAGVRLLTDAGIGAGKVDAALDLGVAMHGTAEPRGEYLLTTYRDAAASGTLPGQVELHRRNGASYEFVRRFDEACPGLHGSFSNEGHTVFGCTDGVLVVAQDGDSFSTLKIPNPAEMPEGARIGTIAGHHELPDFIGVASPGHLFRIDPVAGEMARIEWGEGKTLRAHAFDTEGERFLALDELGVVHLLDPAEAFAVRASVPVVSVMPAEAPFPSIAVSGAAEHAFVTDPVGRSVAVVDLPAAAVSERLALDFSPSGVAWLGIGRHDHAH